jgi:twitching motility protein PilT
MKSVDTYFDDAVRAKASDVHLVAGQVPMMRVDGVLRPVDDKPLLAPELQEAIFSMLTQQQKSTFTEQLELDISHTTATARFRVNLHQQAGAMGLAARLIPKAIPSPQELRLEPQITGLTQLLDGLVLVVGPTGHGKSTTIASLIEEINKTRSTHIVSIEDPVEFVFEPKHSLISQREVGVDTHSFAAALKRVLRQDPNVILVGEMRDPETIATALTAAETGHLVFSTMHTPSAAEAVERIVDVFEGFRQRQVLAQLAAVLRVVVAQQLLPRVGGGRVAAKEILVNTPAVSSLIRENNIAQIRNTILTGGKQGMLTMENSVKALHKEGLIDATLTMHRVGPQRKI